MSDKPSKSNAKSFGNNQSPDLWSPPPYESHATARFSRTNTAAKSSPDDSAYAFLGEFDTIFLVDDSSSMRGRRWKEAENAIATIAPICTRYDKDGIDIYFLNHSREYTNITTAEHVREIFTSVEPYGATPFGKRLLNILTPYMHRINVSGVNASEPVKPLNIIAITDGVFTDDAESVLVNVAKQLDWLRAVPWQVGVQFFQIGNDAAARAYLQELDDELGKRAKKDNLRDIVDTVPWKGRFGQTLSAEGILKCVIGAVNRKYDRSNNAH